MSYTVDTLREIKAEHPEWSLSLVMGTDLFAGFRKWKEPEVITELAELVVICRAGADPPREAGENGRADGARDAGRHLVFARSRPGRTKSGRYRHG